MLVKGPITFFTDVHNAIHYVDRLKDSPNRFCMGDIVDMFDRSLNLNTLGYWRTLGIPTLLGNHDRAVRQSPSLSPADKGFLDGLPKELTLDTDFGQVRLFHATASADDKTVGRFEITDDNVRRFFRPTPATKYVFFGHSHKQYKVQLPSGLTIVNVGALMHGHYAVLDSSGVSFRKLAPPKF